MMEQEQEQNQTKTIEERMVEFEENQNRQFAETFSPKTPKITELIIKYSNGYIKDERQASYVIFLFFIISIIITIYLSLGGTNRSEYPEITPPRTLEDKI